jgi:taurine dioxygenase
MTDVRSVQTASIAGIKTGPAVRAPAFKVELCTPALGAEITGADLVAAASDTGTMAEIRSLWLAHKVLFFRDQHITPMELQTFAAALGPLQPHPTAPMHSQVPLLLPIYRNLDAKKPNAIEQASRENIWHTDLSYVASPSRGAVLWCETCPEVGGDTMWANMALAYERLPVSIKQRLDGLYAKHSVEQIFGAQMPLAQRQKFAAKVPAVEHPVVRAHPESGEKILFVNQAFTTHFSNFYNFEAVRVGQDFAFEANALMSYLLSQAAIPEYQVRLRWRPGTIAIWDNLATQHYAVADYGQAPRRMLRATIKDEAVT